MANGENQNQTPTQEQYDQLKVELEAQVEAERAKAKEAVATATQGLQVRITSLEASLQEKEGELETAKTEVATATGDLEGAKAAYEYAVADYKALVVGSNPVFTPDLIQGASIDELKASAEKANALVGKVKEGLEAQAKALAELTTIPAGAPAAAGLDLSTLSSKEKITQGLQQARKKE